MTNKDARLEKFMAEVYQQYPDYYINFPPEKFRQECEMLLSVQDQMIEKQKGYV